MPIYDSREKSRSDYLINRKLFMDRYKENLKHRVNEALGKGKIADSNKDQKKQWIEAEDLEERHIGRARLPSDYYIVAGNDQYKVGDYVFIENNSEGEGDGGGQGCGNGGTGADDFSFVLTKDEILELYFDDLELPDMVKKSLLKSKNKEWVNTGYSKEGIPPRLSIKKTFEQAIARRIANKREDDEETGRKSPFLDEEDMRYIRREYRILPQTHAVMFCLMDVSASMGEHEKYLAKKFYILLHLFLSKFYTDIEVVFIKYHSEPSRVDEEDFFYSQETGGTEVYKALHFLEGEIDKFDSDKYNMYLAWATDGDMWSDEASKVERKFLQILEQLQYTAYMQVRKCQDYWTLTKLLQAVKTEKVGIAVAKEDKDIYPAFVDLFKKRGLA